MVGVAMRQDDEIEVSKVNALRIGEGNAYARNSGSDKARCSNDKTWERRAGSWD